MTIQEAIESKKPMRRKIWGSNAEFLEPNTIGDVSMFIVEDILATDWEVEIKTEPVELSFSSTTTDTMSTSFDPMIKRLSVDRYLMSILFEISVEQKLTIDYLKDLNIEVKITGQKEIE